jgi:hypothetical protein
MHPLYEHSPLSGRDRLANACKLRTLSLSCAAVFSAHKPQCCSSVHCALSMLDVLLLSMLLVIDELRDSASP